MASDPHTDDLPDRLDQQAKQNEDVAICMGALGDPWHLIAADLRAAAAELRRLRDRDAALTRLLDAVGSDAECVRKMALDISDGPENTWAAELTEIELYLRRIAAAVEGIDQEHER